MQKDKNNPEIEDISGEDEKVIDKEMLQKISSQDKQELLELLNEFILQTYKIEKEFKDYKALYEWVIEIDRKSVV